MDCYAVLGVRRDASQDEIKEAFRQRALECHPDQVNDGEEAAARDEFRRVRTAFEVLSDPEKRAEYDASEREGRSGGQTVEKQGGPRRSYKKAWRRSVSDRPISVSQVLLDKVGGLSAEYEIIKRRRSVTVPLFSLLGLLVFLYEPRAIYATDVFVVDLMLCAVIGGICGFVLGNVWGYTDLLLVGREDSS